MDVDQEEFSQQASSLKALMDRFDGHLDEVSCKMGEVEAMEEEQAQARQKLHEKVHAIWLACGGHLNKTPLATQPTPQPHTQPEPFVLQYIGPSQPVNIMMDEVEESDIRLPSNDAQTYQEWLASFEGEAPRAMPPAPSNLSSCYSGQSIPDPSKLVKVTKLGKVRGQVSLSTRIPASGGGYLSNSDDDTNNYGSDTDTVVVLYKNKCAPKDETIMQVMTLLNGLVAKVNNLLDKLPPKPPSTLKSMHPIIAQHLVTSGQRQPAAPKDNFSPWDQTKDDDCPMDPIKRPVERVAALDQEGPITTQSP
ncbi:hypothetical protein FRC11_012427 [Ceratobasidium sp. 423]|nr:hypothetical protein FRC11_012427 [Ceratobasidium sp. 423]